MSTQPSWSRRLPFGQTVVRTHRLVGREETLQSIDRLIRTDTKIIAIVGAGGIGKTRMLEEVIDRLEVNPLFVRTTYPIDLSDFYCHTRYGLAESIYSAMGNITHSPDLDHLKSEIERKRLMGDTSSTYRAHDLFVKAFEEFLQKINRDRKLVLVFDTAEHLIYQHRKPLTHSNCAESWYWLTQLLQSSTNMVALIAGRPSSVYGKAAVFTKLISFLRVRDISVATIALKPLSQEAALDYYVAVAETVEPDINLVNRIRAINDLEKERIYRLSQGKPILLALTLDHFLHALPRSSLLSSAIADVKTTRSQFEQALVKELQNHPEIRDAIICLGALTKGADWNLISRLLQTTDSKGLLPQRFEELALRLRSLVVIKINRATHGNGAVYFILHDEMRCLLRSHWPYSVGDLVTLNLETREHYRDQIEGSEILISKLWENFLLSSQSESVLQQLSTHVALHEKLLSENLHYMLIGNARRGLITFYQYSQEAYANVNLAFYLSTRAEVLNWLESEDFQELTQDEIQHIRGLVDIGSVIVDLARNEIAEVGPALRKSLRRVKSVLAHEFVECRAAQILARSGDPKQLEVAQKLLDQVIVRLHSRVGSGKDIDDDFGEWLSVATLALAYGQRGYLQRVRGYMGRAIKDYDLANNLYRIVHVDVEHAEVLNNRGFVYCEIGDYDLALDAVELALDLRRRLGPMQPVVLSLNTLAIIKMRVGEYAEARTAANQAYQISELIKFPRGVGLTCLTIAECVRHESKALESLENTTTAIDYAQKALKTFRELSELPRIVEALLEVGRAYRQSARLLAINSQNKTSVLELVRSSRDAFDEARKIAGKDITYRQVDALVNLYVLETFAEDVRVDVVYQYEEIESNIMSLVSDYLLRQTTNTPKIERTDAQVLIWLQLGKFYLHKGLRRLKTYQSLLEVDKFEMFRDLFLGFEYMLLFNPKQHRELQRARNELATLLNKMTWLTPIQVCRFIDKVENEYNKSNCMLRQMFSNWVKCV